MGHAEGPFRSFGCLLALVPGPSADFIGVVRGVSLCWWTPARLGCLVVDLAALCAVYYFGGVG